MTRAVLLDLDRTLIGVQSTTDYGVGALGNDDEFDPTIPTAPAVTDAVVRALAPAGR